MSVAVVGNKGPMVEFLLILPLLALISGLVELFVRHDSSGPILIGVAAIIIGCFMLLTQSSQNNEPDLGLILGVCIGALVTQFVAALAWSARR